MAKITVRKPFPILIAFFFGDPPFFWINKATRETERVAEGCSDVEAVDIAGFEPGYLARTQAGTILLWDRSSALWPSRPTRDMTTNIWFPNGRKMNV